MVDYLKYCFILIIGIVIAKLSMEKLNVILNNEFSGPA